MDKLYKKTKIMIIIKTNRKRYDTTTEKFRRMYKSDRIPLEFFRYISNEKAKKLKKNPSRKDDKQGFIIFLNNNNLTKHYKNCCICFFNRLIEYCHLIPHSENGFYTIDNIVPLCPNHHRCLDRFMLEDWEYYKIQEFIWRRTVELIPFYFEEQH